MTTEREVDLLLDRWLSEGATELSDRALDAALDIVEHSPQRRVLRLPWRHQPVLTSVRLGAAAAIVVVVLLGGLVILRSTTPDVGHSPAPSVNQTQAPTIAPTATLSATPGPTPTLITGTTLLGTNTKLAAGQRYSTARFDPAFEIRGQLGWWYLDGDPGRADFANGPNEPNPPDDYTFGIYVVTRLIPPSGLATATLPPDLIAWLKARTDLSLGAPTTLKVGSLQASAVQGTYVPSDTYPGGVNLMCPAETRVCGNGQPGALGVSATGSFEIVVIKIRGNDVVISMQGPSTDWATNAKVLGPMLSGLSFPGSSN